VSDLTDNTQYETKPAAADEIERLQITDEEREAIAWFAIYADTPGEERKARVLARLLERTKVSR
jgi:hypothetical protein